MLAATNLPDNFDVTIIVWALLYDNTEWHKRINIASLNYFRIEAWLLLLLSLHGLQNDLFIYFGCSLGVVMLTNSCVLHIADMTWLQTLGRKSPVYLEKLLTTPHLVLLCWTVSYM